MEENQEPTVNTEENLCDSCQGSLCGCKAKEESKTIKNGVVVACKEFFPRVRPGHCVACESGGRM